MHNMENKCIKCHMPIYFSTPRAENLSNTCAAQHTATGNRHYIILHIKCTSKMYNTDTYEWNQKNLGFQNIFAWRYHVNW